MLEEGSVVMVVGKMDDNVRPASGEPVYGTVIFTGLDSKKSIMVLTFNGFLWVGPERDVVYEP